MAFPGAGYLAGAFGARLGGAILGTYGEKKRARRRRAEQLQTLGPLEALLTETGPSAQDVALEQRVTQGVLRNLASRGVLGASTTGASVAGAVAPIEERRQARRQGLMERLAAAKRAIYEETDVPGYEEAFAGTLGDVGTFLGVEAGRRRGGKGANASYGSDLEDFMYEEVPDAYGEDLA